MPSAVKSATKTDPDALPDNPMHDLLDLLGERANARHELAIMQIEADRLLQMQARQVQKAYIDFTQLVALLEADIEALVRRHPEMMGDRKSIPTAFGTPKLTLTTSLEVSDEPQSLQLIIEKLDKHCTRFVRPVPTLNLDALKELTDEQLRSVGIRRVVEDKFSIAAAKVPLARAVEAVPATKGGNR